LRTKSKSAGLLQFSAGSVTLHRRKPTPAEAPPLVHATNLTIDLGRRLVTRAGQPIRLTPTEGELLAKLARGDGKVLTHEELLISLWGRAHSHDVQYLRVFVGQLRQKIEADPSAPKVILTQPGVGSVHCGSGLSAPLANSVAATRATASTEVSFDDPRNLTAERQRRLLVAAA
jgi:hypothetical protein